MGRVATLFVMFVMVFVVEHVFSAEQERSQKGDSGCASEKLGVPHVLSD